MARAQVLVIFCLFLLLLSPSCTSSAKTSAPTATPTGGEIENNNNNVVCVASRFADLGLNMNDFGFCNKLQPFHVRAKDLIDSMTLAEKVAQLGDRATGVPRLGLPKYNWWSEALHGVSNVGHATKFDNSSVPGATSFPTVILTTASFNESLWKTIGEVVSTEARAMHNLGLAGLTFWSPNINVVRDPRWGRIVETPGEDPFVAGRYAVNYVRGLQDVKGLEKSSRKDPNSRPLKVAACCKHYAAYDVDNWRGIDRYHFDARVEEQDMVETFNRPFEMCVKEGDVSSVMCSYNQVNGIPACADPKLLNQTIRGDWDLHGYIVSDCDSVQVMFDYQKFLNDTREEAVAQVLRAGMDLDCGDYYSKYGQSAVMQGKVREFEVDKALTNLYVVLMRLGFFDGSPAYTSLGKEDVCSEANIELAAEAARQGIVLLKNSNNTLPLSSNEHKNLAVVGPHAKATSAMIGNYAGIPCQYTSPLDGFSKYATSVDFQAGCANVACKNDALISQAVEAAKKADATIILAGLDLSVEAESLDRLNLLLPGYQTQMINEVASVAKGPVILVLLTAGGVDISFAKDNTNISAILWAGYPGEQGGLAIAEAVFGTFNPAGRLPITWYKSDYVDQLPMTSMQLRPVDKLGYPGRTYKFFNGSTVYPFGYGLSYTHFTYTIRSAAATNSKALTIRLAPRQHCHSINYKDGAVAPLCPAILIDDSRCMDGFKIQVSVHNTGNRDGSDVLMVYSSAPVEVVGAPIKQLVGYQRVFVSAGSTTIVKFALNACKSLGIVGDTANKLLPAGTHTVTVGNGDSAVSLPVNVNFQ